MTNETSPIMAAIEKFEATEANISKLERLWAELEKLVPAGISFGSDAEYDGRTRAYRELLAALPKIDGWKPAAEPYDLDDLAQNRMDALELGEPSLEASVERALDEPGRELREYRFRFSNKRRALIRETLTSIIDQVDADLRGLRQEANTYDAPRQLPADSWTDLRLHIKQIEVLLGSSVQRPSRWSDLHRHMSYGYIGDLNDIEKMDWPQVKEGLRQSLYGMNEPLPVGVDDLAELVAAKPGGTITTELAWATLTPQTFERLIFNLIGTTPAYENPEWLTQTNAPDRGRDLSVMRVISDELAGTTRQRVIIQCKHWLARSVGLADVSSTKEQMTLWSEPTVDVLVVATSGRFTTDAIEWTETHNAKRTAPRIELWPESHLERLLAQRPALIAEFQLR